MELDQNKHGDIIRYWSQCETVGFFFFLEVKVWKSGSHVKFKDSTVACSQHQTLFWYGDCVARCLVQSLLNYGLSVALMLPVCRLFLKFFHRQIRAMRWSIRTLHYCGGTSLVTCIKHSSDCKGNCCLDLFSSRNLSSPALCCYLFLQKETFGKLWWESKSHKVLLREIIQLSPNFQWICLFQWHSELHVEGIRL